MVPAKAQMKDVWEIFLAQHMAEASVGMKQHVCAHLLVYDETQGASF